MADVKEEEDELAVDPGVGAVCDPVTKLRIEAIVWHLDKIPITLQQIDQFGKQVAYRTNRIGNIKALLDFLKEARHGGEPIDASSLELNRLMKEAKAAYRDVRSLQPRVRGCAYAPRVPQCVSPEAAQALVIARRLLARNVALRRLLLASFATEPVGCDALPRRWPRLT